MSTDRPDGPGTADPRGEVAELRRRLTRYQPRRTGHRDELDGWQAATALVLAPDADGPAITVIRRTERPGDRWSGQMALPGGIRDPGDVDLAATAAREAREEVGLHLAAPVARLPDQRGRTSRMLVATFVHVLDEQPALVPQPEEVAAASWLPIRRLVDPAATTRRRWGGVPFPGIEHDGGVIWGLTLRILDSFLDAVGLSRP